MRRKMFAKLFQIGDSVVFIASVSNLQIIINYKIKAFEMPNHIF